MEWESLLAAAGFTVLGFVLATVWDWRKQKTRRKRLTTLHGYAVEITEQIGNDYDEMTKRLTEAENEKDQNFYQSMVNTTILRHDIALRFSNLIAVLVSEDSNDVIKLLRENNPDSSVKSMSIIEIPGVDDENGD